MSLHTLQTAFNSRWLGLIAATAFLAGASGCTQFQAWETSKWMSTEWLDPESSRPVTEVLAYWSNQVHTSQDKTHGDVPLPVLAGRFMLFREGSSEAAEARGSVLVQMRDMTRVAPGVSPPLLAQWKIHPETLKKLRSKDRIGVGYTLYLPWQEYRPDVRVVQVQLYYIPEKGEPMAANPEMVALHSGAPNSPVMESQNYVTPVGAQPR